tara:strand:- start:1210 stop:1611 length:402 start_codon:yes stop_codon:yes gene_type:complete
MATVTSKLTLTSSDLLSQPLSLALSKAITATHTTGLARAPITSTAKGTASGQVTIYTADDYAAIAYLYVKNTDSTAANKIYIYDDTSTGDPILIQLDGGDFLFMPMHGDKTLKAYAPNGSNPVVEFMVFGTDQ